MLLPYKVEGFVLRPRKWGKMIADATVESSLANTSQHS